MATPGHIEAMMVLLMAEVLYLPVQKGWQLKQWLVRRSLDWEPTNKMSAWFLLTLKFVIQLMAAIISLGSAYLFSLSWYCYHCHQHTTIVINGQWKSASQPLCSSTIIIIRIRSHGRSPWKTHAWLISIPPPPSLAWRSMSPWSSWSLPASWSSWSLPASWWGIMITTSIMVIMITTSIMVIMITSSTMVIMITACIMVIMITTSRTDLATGKPEPQRGGATVAGTSSSYEPRLISKNGVDNDDDDIYIMVKCLSVCLSVTKNDHFT